MAVALVGQAAPTFFLGILFILLLSLKADLFPTGGRGTARNLVLPALTLGAFAMASIARLTRSAVLEVLRADYIRTARAKGLAEVLVVAKHTLRNAALPIVTITGLQFGTLLGGAVVTETVFAWPGIGRLAIQSIYNRDYPVVQCTVFLSAVMFIVINFGIELLYGAARSARAAPLVSDAPAVSLPPPVAPVTLATDERGGAVGRRTARLALAGLGFVVPAGVHGDRRAVAGATRSRPASRCADGSRGRRSRGPMGARGCSAPTSSAATCSRA